MVSQGFVVAAIAHTYWSTVTAFADGTSVDATHLMAPVGAEQPEIDVWTADARFVLDQVLAVAQTDPLGEVQGRIDATAVGMFGHSFGGATSLNLLAADARVKAAMNMDGTIYAPALSTNLSLPLVAEQLLRRGHGFEPDLVPDLAAREVVRRDVDASEDA
jgi:predicted dienelactone hydrolase